MDIDKYLQPEFEFSGVDFNYMRAHGISIKEVKEVISNARTATDDFLEEYPEHCRWISTGFSERARCLIIVLKFRDNRFIFQNIKLATEYDIEHYWCRRG